MPEQTIFFDEHAGSKRVQVLKVYDTSYARSCFDEMDENALEFLAKSLNFESEYESAKRLQDIVWEDVEDQAREDGNLLSFFVVTEQSNGWSARLELCQSRRETLDKESTWHAGRSTNLSRW